MQEQRTRASNKKAVNKEVKDMHAINVTNGTAEEIAAIAEGLQGRRDVVTLSKEQRQRLECLNLAKQFHLPLSVVIEHYDTLSQQGTQHGT